VAQLPPSWKVPSPLLRRFPPRLQTDLSFGGKTQILWNVCLAVIRPGSSGQASSMPRSSGTPTQRDSTKKSLCRVTPQATIYCNPLGIAQGWAQWETKMEVETEGGAQR